jgi:tetratricopeptide (TPR) repeat protein
VTDPLPALAEAARLRPDDPAAWRRLADALFRAGRGAEADAAYQRHLLASVNDPVLRRAALDLAGNRLAEAERLLKPHLKQHPTDVGAIRMLAELAGRIGRLDDAEALLTRALELSPGFGAARLNLAMLHLRRQRPTAALEEAARLLAEDPANPAYLNVEGVALTRIGDYADAAARFAQVLEARPGQPRIWLSYGHSLKTVGRSEEAVAAYRRAIALEPTLGEAWWSLANLKSLRFTAEDRAAMTAALAQEGLREDDALHLHFTLGKAQEDAAVPADAFAHYAAGNRIRAAQLGYDPTVVEEQVEALIATCDARFFAERAGQGDPRPDPIFVLGMPRSGSTLVEQILASHPAIEGTRELPDIEMLARRLAPTGPAQAAALAQAQAAQLTAMGAAYLEATRIHRKLARARFIDKMPNNWLFVPMIRLILPGARIIDTRRGAMACCFSNFKQHYARGQAFSYRLDHLARYYRAYVRLMDHLDAVLPGAVHRVRHEAMVEDAESETRRLLAYLGLPFDPACLRFWETERAVQTASSEQVRRPIFRDGLDQWQAFAPYLAELAEGLGDLAAT